MDQGLAGLLAGAAGLVGAGIGGLATAYGARIGAEKTIEAAQTQVEKQSQAEHRHWVREQRKQACVGFMEALDTCMLLMAPVTAQIGRNSPVSEDAIEAFDAAVTDLTVASAQLQLWGPDSLFDKAWQLVAAVGVSGRSIRTWPGVQADGDSAAVREHQEDCDAKSESVGNNRLAFVAAVRETLASDH